MELLFVNYSALWQKMRLNVPVQELGMTGAIADDWPAGSRAGAAADETGRKPGRRNSR